MKPLSPVLFIFLAVQLYAQPAHLQGTIVDAQTGKPIPSATLSVAAKNFFYPADDSGKFSIDDQRLDKADTLSISCIGYQTQKMVVNDIAANATIRLSPMVTLLGEVKIGYKVMKVGSEVKSSSGSSSFLPGMEEAMFMVGSAGHSSTLKSVGFYLGKGGNIFVKGHGDVTAPFRVRVYAADSNRMPGKELVNDVIIAAAKKNNEWFDIDVSGYQIETPENGFFVAFVLLDVNYYKIHAGYQDGHGFVTSSEGLFTPHLGLTQHEFKELFTFMKIHTHSGAVKWIKDVSGFNTMIRATIVTN